MTVRECLETFEFPSSNVGVPREPEMTRDDVLDAVKDGLSAQAPMSKEIEFNRDDLFDAVKAGLEDVPTPMGGIGEKVLDKMEEMIDGMRVEFKQYSVANGGDTEQVLDAMKDGLEVLRADIETYVDRAADVTGKDEIIETVKNGLEHLRMDLEEVLPMLLDQTSKATVESFWMRWKRNLSIFDRLSQHPWSALAGKVQREKRYSRPSERDLKERATPFPGI